MHNLIKKMKPRIFTDKHGFLSGSYQCSSVNVCGFIKNYFVHLLVAEQDSFTEI